MYILYITIYIYNDADAETMPKQLFIQLNKYIQIQKIYILYPKTSIYY